MREKRRHRPVNPNNIEFETSEVRFILLLSAFGAVAQVCFFSEYGVVTGLYAGTALGGIKLLHAIIRHEWTGWPEGLAKLIFVAIAVVIVAAYASIAAHFIFGGILPKLISIHV